MEFSLVSAKPVSTNRRAWIYDVLCTDFDIKSKFGLGYTGKYSESLQDLLLTHEAYQLWDSFVLKLTLDFKREEAPWLKNLQLFRTECVSRFTEELTSILGKICGGREEFEFRIRLSGKHLEDHFEMETTITGTNLDRIHSRICLGDRRTRNNSGIAFHEVNGKAFDWTSATSFQWFLTVDLLLSDNALNAIHSGKHPLQKVVMKNFNATIVANDGAKVKCDKNVLSDQCQYFEKVFKSGMQEELTSTVELSYLSEAGVKSLLEYFYHGEIIAACRNCSIGVELLLAADMYCIQDLGESIRGLILEKSYTWFSVSNAVQIFRFNKLKSKISNDPEIQQQIQKKIIAVLKSKSDDELNGCEEYRQLFTDPLYAMELFMVLLRN